MVSIPLKCSPCMVPPEKILDEHRTGDERITVSKDRFNRWLQVIFNTQEDEISCSDCFDMMSHFVEMELSGKDAAGSMPQLKHHLDQCPACREEYENVRNLQMLENMGALPSVDDLEDLIH
jgi:hypothetical protein